MSSESPKLNKRIRNFLISFIIFTCLGMLIKHYADIAQENSHIQQQEQIRQQINNLRAGFEREINTTLNLTMGVLIYVSSKPGIGQEEFAILAKSIIQHAPYVRNIGLAKDNIITHIFPLEGNQKALGLRYMDNPNQRNAVLQAMQTRQTVIAGPVDLVQGGRGLISRIPIFLNDERQSYWGMTSVVVNVEAFFGKVGLLKAKDKFSIAVRGKDSKGDQGDVFFGDASLFANKDAVKVDISLPTGKWVIAALPLKHVETSFNESSWILLLGLSGSAIVCLLLFGLLSSNSALSQAKAQVEQASEYKARFFTNMAHELRTPLTSIHGAIRLINSGVVKSDPKQSKELLASAERNSKRLIWLINDILDLRKLESGKMEYQKTLQSPSSAVEDAINDIQPYASEYNIKIDLQDTVPSGVKLNIDNMRIQQVIVNFLSNAVKFSPQNSTISVVSSHAANLWRVEVADQGSGIPADNLNTIFSEFSQASSSDKKEVASTGLGLSISRHIINDHSGNIGCYNQINGGAIFYAELPIHKAVNEKLDN